MAWTKLPTGEWLPDSSSLVLPALETGGLTELSCAMPTEFGYRNCKRPLEAGVGTAADQKLTGAGNGLQTDGTYQMFAGGATKLFRYSTGWTDASRTVGGAYTGGVANWSLAEFGPLMISTNGVDTPQKFTIGGTGNFSALGGTPPIAKYVIVVRDFVVFLNVSGATNRAHWSAINNAEDYVASATTQSDTQDIPDQGPIIGAIGGEYGLIFFANAVYRMTYVGSPLFFQFDRVGGIGLAFPMSVARRGEDVFYVSREGFAVVRSGQLCQNIGTGKINRYFLASIGTAFANPTRHFGAIDPENSLYVFALSTGATSNCDYLFYYHWPTDHWGFHDLNQAAESPANKLELIFQTTVSGAVVVAAVDLNHKFTTFTSTNNPFFVTSMVFEPFPGHRFFLRGVRALVSEVPSGRRITVTTYPRQPLASEATIHVDGTGFPVVPGANGVAPFRASGRYLSVTGYVNYVGEASAANWVYQGWELDLVPAGGG